MVPKKQYCYYRTNNIQKSKRFIQINLNRTRRKNFDTVLAPVGNNLKSKFTG